MLTRMAKQWRSVDESRQEARKTAVFLSEEISKTAEAFKEKSIRSSRSGRTSLQINFKVS